MTSTTANTTVKADAGLPDGVQPWAHVLCNSMVDGSYGISRAVRSRDDDELESMARHIPRFEHLNAAFLAVSGLPAPKGRGFWLGAVLPAITAELQRRRRPPRPQGQGRIAQMKARLHLEMIASRYTHMRPAGPGKLRGLCPLHSEKTASFIVDIDRQTWKCFGCSTHGDVIDLVRRLRI